MRAGFSLVELVIVVVIIGIIGAIAIPRVTRSGEGARLRALEADLVILQKAADLYEIEHAGDSPAHPGGVLSADAVAFMHRLTRKTDPSGSIGGWFGPYLRALPANPVSGLRTIRIDGAPAGANTHGWRFDSTTRLFAADDSPESALVKPGQKALGKDNELAIDDK